MRPACLHPKEGGRAVHGAGQFTTRFRRALVQGQHEDLWDAADCGDVDAVRRMVADGADVEQVLFNV